jgi:excisionase family DNA binding protein
VDTQTSPSEYPDIPNYSLTEAAAYLRVSKQTIWRWVRSGQLPAVRVGVRYRIRREDLDGMVKAA